MTQTATLEQAIEITQYLSHVDKLRLIEYLLPALKQEAADLTTAHNGETHLDQVAELEDTLARPDQIKAAIALLRAWREEGDVEEQRETLAVLQAAFSADFPDETPAGL